MYSQQMNGNGSSEALSYTHGLMNVGRWVKRIAEKSANYSGIKVVVRHNGDGMLLLHEQLPPIVLRYTAPVSGFSGLTYKVLLEGRVNVFLHPDCFSRKTNWRYFLYHDISSAIRGWRSEQVMEGILQKLKSLGAIYDYQRSTSEENKAGIDFWVYMTQTQRMPLQCKRSMFRVREHYRLHPNIPAIFVDEHKYQQSPEYFDNFTAKTIHRFFLKEIKKSKKSPRKRNRRKKCNKMMKSA